MINLVRIYLKNFAAFYYKLGLSEIEINRYDSPNKIVLILGENGSGKSSLLSEITPLPLEHTNNRTKSRIIPDKDGIKELEYIVDDEIFYKIYIEYSKKTNCYISKRHISDSEYTELNPTGNVSTYMEILEKELGFSKNYTKVGYLTNTITNFVNMKPAERNVYISEWLPNIALFLQGYKIASKKFLQKKKDVESINRDLGKMLTINYELQLNELKNSMSYINNQIQSINDNIVKANVYLNDWGNYTYQFNHLAQLRDTILSNFNKLNNYRAILIEKSEKYKKYNGKEGELLLLKDIKNTEKFIELSINNLKTIDNDLLKLDNSIKEKQILTNNTNIDKSLTEVISFIESQEKELNELKLLEKSIKEDNEKALVIFENMDISNIYEFFSIIDFISSIYENMEKEGASSIEDIKNEIYKHTSYVEEIEESLAKIETDMELLNVERRRLEDADDLRDLIKQAPKGCTPKQCAILAYLNKFLNIQKENDVISSKLENLRIIKENKVNLQSISREKILHYTRILENVQEIDNFLMKKRTFFANFSPFLIDLLSISDTFFIINKIIEIKALIPSFKEFLQFNERVKILEKSIIELKNIKNEIIIKNDLEKEIKELEELNNKRASIKNDIKFYENQLEDLKVIDEIQVKLREEIKNFNSKVEEVNKQKEQYLILVKGAYYYKSLSDSLIRLEKEKAIKQKEYSDLELQKEQLQTDYLNKQQLEKMRNTILEEMNRFKTLMEIWSPKVGYPAWEIEDFLYRLKEETNNDLNSLWFSNLTVEDFEIGQNLFSIMVRSNEVIIPDASELSESERATLALAISFAIIEMNLSNKKYNITRLDEQDGMLDGIRRKAFLNTIENMIERMDCRTCFIVTHNNEFENINADVILLTNPNNELYSSLLKNKNIIFHL